MWNTNGFSTSTSKLTVSEQVDHSTAVLQFSINSLDLFSCRPTAFFAPLPPQPHSPVRILDALLRASCQVVQSLWVGALGPTPLRAN